MFPPRRLVCLTEETAETLHLLGAQHRIVGARGIGGAAKHHRGPGGPHLQPLLSTAASHCLLSPSTGTGMRIIAAALVTLAALSLQAAPFSHKAIPASLGLAPVVELVARGCGLGWHRDYW